VVVDGDTLTRISRKFYGTSARWEEILRANHDVLKDEKSLVVGSTLKIP
jgi:nucleoid-associated protein YgaU